ncbi:hypothetical protein GNX71_18545 [Variovorax sp. RKNM96]|uniref:dATP/dGTP diphosphohydrolase domain-containing protein n=1 Tax=Variovorax sp. RKNM96 TaxID=2681552 RepID=UPI0019813183|nr:dATP/dGTP diphosphohydrolase domain-containing protein [Variovorax sp. RKNM96]QSI31469.1 hypothetical protein GNX71_18545 [Variovorax sp. RKNM96]
MSLPDYESPEWKSAREALVGDAHEALTFHSIPTAAGPTTKLTNPKEAIGSSKLNFSVVPSSLTAYAATAFTEGALKYGSYNWRVAGVRASTYKSAHDRHVSKWWNGENFDPKTKVHHLANAMACLGIILDAELVGLLNDDRPPKADMAGLIERLEATTAHLAEMSKGLNPVHHTEKQQPA